MRKNKLDPRQPKTEYYNHLGFEQKYSFMDYWYQLEELKKINPKKILEVGIANGLLSSLLKFKGLNITTFDIDKELKPDIVGDLKNISDYFKEKEFDVVVLAQVLEHLPFKDFENIIKQLSKISKNVIISLPEVVMHITYLSVKIPKLGERILDICLPFPRFWHKVFSYLGLLELGDSESSPHYWEINDGIISEKKIKNIMKKYFKIKDSYSVPKYNYHKFFILSEIVNNKIFK